MSKLITRFVVIVAAVRFGRVPKREKAKILAAMQSVNARLAERSLPAEFANEAQLMQAVVRAHVDTCDFTRDKVHLMMADAHRQPNYTACPPTLVSCASLFATQTPGKHRSKPAALARGRERCDPRPERRRQLFCPAVIALPVAP